jgi:hypothetical protein
MKRHLIWIIAGTATIGLAVPAFAAMQPATPDDNGIPGEIRGNCDEAEHANDPECLAVEAGPTTPNTVDVPVVSSPSTTIATPSTTIGTSTTAPDSTLPRSVPTTSIDDRPTGSIAPTTSVSGDGPVVTVPDGTVPTSVPGDISGPCDEAEHANDPRCTGSTTDDDRSGRGSDDDDRSGHGDDDRDGSSGRGSDDDDDRDDSSGRGSDDDDDDDSGHGSDDDGDDDSGHGSD